MQHFDGHGGGVPLGGIDLWGRGCASVRGVMTVKLVW